MAQASLAKPAHEAVAAYKRMLSDVLERRPSGTRQRLASALAKNRSFVSQITNPAYATPIPAAHLATIFELCHFSAAERLAFTRLYALAHPKKRLAEVQERSPRMVELPDLGSVARNEKLAALVSAFMRELVQLINDREEGQGR